MPVYRFTVVGITSSDRRIFMHYFFFVIARVYPLQACLERRLCLVFFFFRNVTCQVFSECGRFSLLLSVFAHIVMMTPCLLCPARALRTGAAILAEPARHLVCVYGACTNAVTCASALCGAFKAMRLSYLCAGSRGRCKEFWKLLGREPHMLTT